MQKSGKLGALLATSSAAADSSAEASLTGIAKATRQIGEIQMQLMAHPNSCRLPTLRSERIQPAIECFALQAEWFEKN